MCVCVVCVCVCVSECVCSCFLFLFLREIVVPMIPDIEGENDTSYFEEYDDEEEHVEHIAEEDQEKFSDF